jgi:GAF domain-containing protein
LRGAYVAALREHVRRGDEATLRAGYELGRAGVADGLGTLELAAIHHDGLVHLLHEEPADAEALVAAAGAFFQEVLSAFEMVVRGYHEATAAAAAERRETAMLRRLSSFLADASLSARHAGAAVEVLHLVADCARELTDADYCIARWGALEEEVRAISTDADTDAAPPAELEHLERVAATLPTRVSPAEWREQPALRSRPEGTVLTVPFRALDGRIVGSLQLVGKRGGNFDARDEATAGHLADMAAAALERAELYRPV